MSSSQLKIARLDLALLVDGDDDGMSGWVHIETDDILDLLGEFGIIGALERPQTMRLEAMGVPQTLDGAQRDADGLGHRVARPMGGFGRRNVADRLEEPAMVEPVYPFERGELSIEPFS